MPSKDENAARQEKEALERSKAVPFYTRKVVRELAIPRKPGKLTPSKRG